MGQPVVLPKFELPGDKPHWAVRLAWGTGAVLLVSVLGLGAVIVHRHGLENQVQAAKEEALAKAKAEAERKVAAAATALRMAREAELAAKQAARTVAANTVPSAAESEETKAPKASHVHRGRTGGASHAAKVASAPSASSDALVDKSGPKSGGKRADVIDELMAKMK